MDNGHQQKNSIQKFFAGHGPKLLCHKMQPIPSAFIALTMPITSVRENFFPQDCGDIIFIYHTQIRFSVKMLFSRTKDALQ